MEAIGRMAVQHEGSNWQKLHLVFTLTGSKLSCVERRQMTAVLYHTCISTVWLFALFHKACSSDLILITAEQLCQIPSICSAVSQKDNCRLHTLNTCHPNLLPETESLHHCWDAHRVWLFVLVMLSVLSHCGDRPPSLGRKASPHNGKH